MAIPLTAIISGMTAAGQLAGGASKLLKNRKRPQYEVPDSARQALAIAQAQYADPTMPGYEQAEENINLAVANAIQGMQESGNARVGFQGAVAQGQSALRELTGQNAMYNQQEGDQLQAALEVMAQREDTQFQMNEFAPYSDAVREGRDMIGGGLENLMTAAEIGSLSISDAEEEEGSGLGVNPLGMMGGGVSNTASSVSAMGSGVQAGQIAYIIDQLSKRGY